jgi:hypothetical protein
MARPLAVCEPVRFEPRAHVYCNLPQRAVARVREAVRFSGGDHDHVAGRHLDLLVAAAEGGLSLEHDEDLGVIVPVQ